MEDLYVVLGTKLGCGVTLKKIYNLQGKRLTSLSEMTSGLVVLVVPPGYQLDGMPLPAKLTKTAQMPGINSRCEYRFFFVRNLE
jgi:hypothetical protein